MEAGFGDAMEAAMHFHTETCTTRDLGRVLDELSGPDTTRVTPQYLGGRDWVVIAEHGDHEPLPTDAATAFAADDTHPFVSDFDTALDGMRTDNRSARDTLADQ